MIPGDNVLADVRGYFQSRAILTAAELDLFSRLDENPRSAEAMASGESLDLRALTRVLDCMVVFGLLEKTRGVYGVTERGRPLSSHHPETVLPMVRHMDFIWRNWSNLTAVVREGHNPHRQPVVDSSGDEQRAFIEAMHVIGRDLAGEVAESLPLSEFRKLLDVGGATGTYVMAFLRENPHMRAVLFDFPQVVEWARERLEAEGFIDRVDLAGGDFYKDELPGGCDVALLSAIIHQNSTEQNLLLYKKVRRALEPGGMIVIRDHVMDESRVEPPGGAVFALNMLVNTEGGDTYTFAEIEQTLLDAGYVDPRLARSGPNMDCLVTARKPA